MAKFDYILWDWNGTLLDDVDIGIEVINQMLSARNMPVLKGRKAYRDVFCFPVKNYYQTVGFDFSIESFEDLSIEYVKIYDSKKPKLFPDALKALEFAQKSGLTQLILSASEKNHLQKKLQDFGLTCFFEKLLTLDNFFASGKIDIAQQWLSQSGLNPKRVLLVGDTLHDKQVAEVLGCSCVLVNQGHQSLKSAQNSGIPIVETLSEVTNYF